MRKQPRQDIEAVLDCLLKEPGTGGDAAGGWVGGRVSAVAPAAVTLDRWVKMLIQDAEIGGHDSGGLCCAILTR